MRILLFVGNVWIFQPLLNKDILYMEEIAIERRMRRRLCTPAAQSRTIYQTQGDVPHEKELWRKGIYLSSAGIHTCRVRQKRQADADHVAACDYVGVVSGNNEPDKFAKAGFHATRSEFVDAPLIDELAVAVECVLKSYDPETCLMVGDIVNVSVDERVLNAEGKVDVASA